MTIKFGQVPLCTTEHMYYNDSSTYERGSEPCHNNWVLASLNFRNTLALRRPARSTSLTCGGKRAFVAHDVATKSTILFQNGDSTSARTAVIRRLLSQERFFIKHVLLCRNGSGQSFWLPVINEVIPPLLWLTASMSVTPQPG